MTATDNPDFFRFPDRDRQSASAVDRLASQLTEMQRKIAALEAGARSSQLPFSTVEGGRVIYRDGTGLVRQVVGRQADGTYTVRDLNAPAPPRPNTPTLEPSMAGLTVSWTGTFSGGDRPTDFSHVLVYVSPVESFIPGPSNLAGTLREAGSLPVGPLGYSPHYAVLIAVNTSGVESVPSFVAGPATPSRILGTDLFPATITETQVADGSISTPKLQANSVTALNILAEAIKAYHIQAGAITADKLEAVLVLASRIIAGDQDSWHLELGDATTPILWWNNETTGFALTRDPQTGESNVFLSGRMKFGNGSLIESDVVDLMEQPATGFQEPKLRQGRHWIDSTVKTSLNPQWVSATQRTNCLIMSVFVVSEGGTPTINTPSGWTLITSQAIGVIRHSLYYVPNALLSRSAETITTNIAVRWAVGMFEYQGLAVAPLDRSAGALSGSGVTTANSGSTATTTQADELWLAFWGGNTIGFSNGANNKFKNPTNGFRFVLQSDGTGNQGFAVASRRVTSTGVAQSSVTTPNSPNANLVVAFKLAPAAPTPAAPAAKSVRFYTQRRGNASTPHVIDENGAAYPLGRFPFCRATLNVNVLITGNNDVYAQGDWSVIYDSDSMVAISQNVSTFSNVTIPLSGYYVVDFRAMFGETTNTTDAGAAFVTKNGRSSSNSIARDIHKFVNTGADGSPVRATRIVPLVAGDILYWGNWSSVNANLIAVRNSIPTELSVSYYRPL